MTNLRDNISVIFGINRFFCLFPSLRKYYIPNRNIPKWNIFPQIKSGEGGIRTLGSQYDCSGFRDRPVRPLRHLSVRANYTLNAPRPEAPRFRGCRRFLLKCALKTRPNGFLSSGSTRQNCERKGRLPRRGAPATV